MAGAFAAYDKVEYLVPEAERGPLLWAWYQQPDELPRFDCWRDRASDDTREILVCTHGSVDAACGKFGYPLYHLLRQQQANASLRVWRVSHFGGHVFAPTLIDMPSGHFWAYVEPPQAVQIARREGEVAALRGHYRGWSGLESGFLQAAERELWQRYGWQWFDFQRVGVIRAKDETGDEPRWAEVEISYRAPDGSTGRCRARVETAEPITTISTTGQPYTHPYAQYLVTESRLAANTDMAR